MVLTASLETIRFAPSFTRIPNVCQK